MAGDDVKELSGGAAGWCVCTVEHEPKSVVIHCGADAQLAVIDGVKAAAFRLTMHPITWRHVFRPVRGFQGDDRGTRGVAGVQNDPRAFPLRRGMAREEGFQEAAGRCERCVHELSFDDGTHTM